MSLQKLLFIHSLTIHLRNFSVDRHLFALKMLFEQLQQEHQDSSALVAPRIFTDPGYQTSGTWRMSTSHCGSASLSLFGFGPVVRDGFGIGYMIKNNSISFNITRLVEVIFFFFLLHIISLLIFFFFIPHTASAPLHSILVRYSLQRSLPVFSIFELSFSLILKNYASHPSHSISLIQPPVCCND